MKSLTSENTDSFASFAMVQRTSAFQCGIRMVTQQAPSVIPNTKNLAKNPYANTDGLFSTFPLSFAHIATAQGTDRDLQRTALSDPKYKLQSFCGGGKSHDLITRDLKIVIPKILQCPAVEWYHDYLCHPGETRTEATLRQHFWWSTLRMDVHQICTACSTCQRTKKKISKYGHLPEKMAEAEPWHTLCIDLIGPYTINRKNKRKKALTLWALTMIDPATGWFEMREISTKSADIIANELEMAWLSRYPWPTQMIFDRGNEFKAEVAEMITKDYGIKKKPISTRNPQANVIVERVHQTIGNMIRTFELYDNDELDDDDPWSGILTAVMAAVRSTYSTTMQATPMQLVFGRDAIMNIPFQADWDYIRQRKQHIIHQNNVRENAKQKAYHYQVGEKILLANPPHQKYGGPQYEGPYVILAVHDNGMLTIQKPNYSDVVNIRNIKPFLDR